MEERNIPWSQQVDEASYENLSSPTGDENTCMLFENIMHRNHQSCISYIRFSSELNAVSISPIQYKGQSTCFLEQPKTKKTKHFW